MNTNKLSNEYQNPAVVYLDSLSNSSQRTLRQALNVIAGILTGDADYLICEWAALRFQHTSLVQSRLANYYAPATVNKMLSALRGVLKTAWKLDLMSLEDYARASSIKDMKNNPLPTGRELQSGEISALLKSCQDDPTPAGVRDMALLALLYSCGLRREEPVNLDLSDYDPVSGDLKILHAKLNKQRMNYLVDGAARAMDDWLNLRGDEPGPLFWPINKGGRLVNRRMTSQAIYNILQKRKEQSGIKDCSLCDLRRTYVSHSLAAGADISIVAGLVGHSSVATTARYDRRPEEARRKAAKLLHVPYGK